MMVTLTFLCGVLFAAFPISAGHLFRAQIAVHDALLNSSRAANSSISNLTLNATKASSEGLPVFDPQEERYSSGLRLLPYDFQKALYLFKTMDKDRNNELSADEFNGPYGLPEEAPAAANAGKSLWKPLVQNEASMKPLPFYRFFALAMAKSAEFAWQKGERVELSSYFQDEKAKLLRLFITYDVNCDDGITASELHFGFNSTLLQTVRAAKIPVANLFANQREMKFATADFHEFAMSGSDGYPGKLSFVEFVKLGNEANRKAYAPVQSKSPSPQVFGCLSALFLMTLVIQ